jgi:hypothetical protein
LSHEVLKPIPGPSPLALLAGRGAGGEGSWDRHLRRHNRRTPDKTQQSTGRPRSVPQTTAPNPVQVPCCQNMPSPDHRRLPPAGPFAPGPRGGQCFPAEPREYSPAEERAQTKARLYEKERRYFESVGPRCG